MERSILVVDDEARIRNMIARYLHEKQFQVYKASNGKEALETMASRNIGLVILDLMMPLMDGAGFIKEVRKVSDVYIIVLTATTGEDKHVDYYRMGVDDYVEKPFSVKALTAKVSAVFARLDKKAYGHAVVQADEARLDEHARQAFVGERTLQLKPKEYELLAYLMRNANIMLSREQILMQVWGADYNGGDRTVDIHISHLRKKLGDYADYIQTASGYGYKFEVKR
jgi:DNA-binding response OmpR family regulator